MRPGHVLHIAALLCNTLLAGCAFTLPARSRIVRACAPDVSVDVAPQVLTEVLGTERAAEVWARRPAGELPNEKQQAALIQWLQTGPLATDPERLLHMCLRREILLHEPAERCRSAIEFASLLPSL